jgi:hypothetical protein
MLNNRRGVAAVALVGLLGVAGCSGTPPASVVTVGVIGPGYDERGCGVGRQPEGAGGSGEVYESVRGIVVLVAGHSVVDFHTASSPWASRSLYSVTKSVMSTLVAIALAQHRLAAWTRH